MPRSAKMWRAVWLFALAAALSGCEDRAPAVPERDSGSSLGPRDGGDLPPDGGHRRPDAGPRLPAADLEVTLPHGGPEVRLPVEVGADLGTLDVFLSIDTTGSFGGEIDALQRDLVDRIVPALAARVPDVALGVGRFEDFPVGPFGSEGDAPFDLVSAVTTDLGRVASAVASLDDPLGSGGDGPESGAEALWQIATGAGYDHGGTTYVAPFGGRAAPGGGDIGGVGFREGALRVVVHVTDATSHAPDDYAGSFPGTHSLEQAADALRAIDARAIGVASGPSPRLELERLAIRTGAIAPPDETGCRTGIGGEARSPVDGTCPLVFDVAPDGTGLSSAIVDAIGDLLDTVHWREVFGEADEDPLGFVRAIAALDATVAGGATPPSREDRRPSGDGIDDTFVEVRPGTSVRFELVLRNETVLPADYDQVFRVVVRIVGDDLVLVTRTVRVIVPRGRLDGGPRELDGGPRELDGGAALDAGDDGGTPIDADDALDAG